MINNNADLDKQPILYLPLTKDYGDLRALRENANKDNRVVTASCVKKAPFIALGHEKPRLCGTFGGESENAAPELGASRVAKTSRFNS